MIKNKTKMSTFPTSIYIILGVLALLSGKKKKYKATKLKEVVKMSLFTNNTAIYVENLMKLLKTPRANEFNKALGYKIMQQRTLETEDKEQCHLKQHKL